MRMLTRVAFMLVLLSASAIIASAQTAINSGSLTGDPTVKYKGGDPPCTPPYCYNLDYTGPVFPDTPYLDDLAFFEAVTPFPTEPPEYSCEASGGLFCFPVDLGNKFIGDVVVFLADGPFMVSVTGGPVDLTVPDNVSCTDCGPHNTMSLDPVPEPNTGLLYLTGLLLLGYAVRKGAELRRARKIPDSLRHSPAA